MKYVVMILALLVLSVVFVSGCATTPDTGNTGATGELTAKEKEDLAYQAIDNEIDQALENMTLEDIENELLNQG